jgi:hypothetical protein
MKRGRKSKIKFGVERANHIAEKATRANNMGIYTVESLVDGICYFFESGECVVAGGNGYVRMSIDTAKQVAEELSAIIEDVAHNDRKPMSSRAIGKMLEGDF